jgi:excisionase family DNA binding protein
LSTSPSTIPITAEPLSLIDRLKNFQRALTPEELADLLQVSRLTIVRKAKKGTIPSFRVGTCVRFDPKSVALWLMRRGVQ